MEKIWDDYMRFLILRANLQQFKDLEKIFKLLHNISFSYVLYRDNNRAEDGVALRKIYLENNYLADHLLKMFQNRECSVLEMLIGLAIRVDNEYIGDPGEEHPEYFFIEMIENLGLCRLKQGPHMNRVVYTIAKTWMDRKFKRNGQGSPFPVKYDDRDQRELEIWDQMNSYVNENFR